jgi:hypothetical protein
MSIFLTQIEIDQINRKRSHRKYSNLYWGMLGRVKKYCHNPGLLNHDTTTEWWHHAAEYVTEVAWAYRFGAQNETVKSWLRSTTLELVRRPDDDWVGPFFRKRLGSPESGNLETTHLSIAVSIAYDLCPEIFTENEQEEIRQKLQHVAIPLCREWLKSNTKLANWRCILLAGLAVPAAVLGDEETLAFALEEYKLCLNVIQPDGSYSESLQYSNYCYFGLMYAYESLVRAKPELADDISIEPYAKAVTWFVHSYFYNKPLDGWGPYPRPRSANFNDSAAIFGADPDLLMHISARVKDSMPEIAGMARWMFDKLYIQNPAQGPFDLNTFGFVNRYSFLSMLYYPQAAEPLAPDEAGLPLTAYYTNGDCLAKNSWDENESRTILAFRGAPDGMYGPGHLHADLNSLILVHNKERMLADTGHSCYRNAIHNGYECLTQSHNTCTFRMGGTTIQQHLYPKRLIDTAKKPEPPIDRKAKQLIAARADDLSVFGADAAGAYDDVVETFERFTILCGEHALFVIDRIQSSKPVKACWNWLLNNRDGQLEYKLIHPDRIVARRGGAGMKLFHIGPAEPEGPKYGHIHDAYHPLPSQRGEGASGSGRHFTWVSHEEATEFQRIHAIALDDYGPVVSWHLRYRSDTDISLEGQDENWDLLLEENRIVVTETFSGRTYVVEVKNEKWTLNKEI